MPWHSIYRYILKCFLNICFLNFFNSNYLRAISVWRFMVSHLLDLHGITLAEQVYVNLVGQIFCWMCPLKQLHFMEEKSWICMKYMCAITCEELWIRKVSLWIPDSRNSVNLKHIYLAVIYKKSVMNGTSGLKLTLTASLIDNYLPH